MKFFWILQSVEEKKEKFIRQKGGFMKKKKNLILTKIKGDEIKKINVNLQLGSCCVYC